jgi:hypothetical protein
MSKVIGVAVALVIVKGCEIIVIYRAMPILRRLWEKVLATGNVGYSFEMCTLSFHSATRSAVSALQHTFLSRRSKQRNG